MKNFHFETLHFIFVDSVVVEGHLVHSYLLMEVCVSK